LDQPLISFHRSQPRPYGQTLAFGLGAKMQPFSSPIGSTASVHEFFTRLLFLYHTRRSSPLRNASRTRRSSLVRGFSSSVFSTAAASACLHGPRLDHDRAARLERAETVEWRLIGVPSHARPRRHAASAVDRSTFPASSARCVAHRGLVG